MVHYAIPVDVLESTVDWAGFWVSVVASAATLAAVIVAIVQVSIARSDAKQARKDAADARRDADAERVLRVATEKSFEAREKAADVERRAARSAQWVRVSTTLLAAPGSRPVAPDGYGELTVTVSNDSAHPISDVRVALFPRVGDRYLEADLDFHPRPSQVIDNLSAQNFKRLAGLTYVGLYDSGPDERLVTVVTFSDFHGDRWRLDWDGRLTLLERRVIVWEESGTTTASTDPPPPPRHTPSGLPTT